MFIGRHSVSVDAKGRIHLPAKLRDVLLKDFEPPLIVTISNNCLSAYPVREWREKYEALDSLPYTPEKDNLLRLVSENAEEAPIRNGRILLPARLREYAGILKEVVIIGRMKKIEIWSAERRREATAELTDLKLSEDMGKLGF